MKTVTILGSTGSVGRATVDLILSQPANFSVRALVCNRNADLLAEQALKLRPALAVVADAAALPVLQKRLAGTDIECAGGPEAVIRAATMPVAWTMAAIVGIAGLPSVMAAARRGGIIAIANKEPLVAAGPFVMKAARESGATILPVDSEHNAVFQVFDRDRPEGIDRIILTASGGPFLNRSRAEMESVTPAQAVAHPNWSMGAKISVDSATMMNKALELIEAHYLFDLPPEKIEVVVHPQSIVHSMVEYRDGSVLAQMGAPDMKTPIAHTLAWPARMETTGRRLDFSAAMRLDFQPPDRARFPALDLAYDCLRRGLWACVAMNAANEAAVAAFLENRISFTHIVEIVRCVVDTVKPQILRGIDDVAAIDKTVRMEVESRIMTAGLKAKVS